MVKKYFLKENSRFFHDYFSPFLENLLVFYYSKAYFLSSSLQTKSIKNVLQAPLNWSRKEIDPRSQETEDWSSRRNYCCSRWRQHHGMAVSGPDRLSFYLYRTGKVSLLGMRRWLFLSLHSLSITVYRPSGTPWEGGMLMLSLCHGNLLFSHFKAEIELQRDVPQWAPLREVHHKGLPPQRYSFDWDWIMM